MRDWFTPRQAAKEVGRSVRTIRRWIEGGMPVMRIEGRTFIRADDLYAQFRAVLTAEPESKTRWER